MHAYTYSVQRRRRAMTNTQPHRIVLARVCAKFLRFVNQYTYVLTRTSGRGRSSGSSVSAIMEMGFASRSCSGK